MNNFIISIISLISVSTTFANEENNDLNKNLQVSTEILDEVKTIKRLQNWAFTKIRIRTRGKIGLEVPYLAKLELKPFVEFHYSK